MESEILRLCGMALICAVAAAVVSRLSGGAHEAVRIGGLALVMSGCVLFLGEAVEAIAALTLGDIAAAYAELMLRALGIAAVCRVCADICRDCGAPSVASAVETGGKLAVVLLALPTVADVLDSAAELVAGI